MNTDEKTPEPVAGDIAGATGTPDAIEAASARRSDPAIDPALNREHRVGRGVEWVRPTDLMAQTGSRMARTGIDFQSDMARRSRHAATTSARALALRARRLPPVSAFGRGHADRTTTRDAVGIP